jgi:class 3 adenylate cyclase
VKRLCFSRRFTNINAPFLPAAMNARRTLPTRQPPVSELFRLLLRRNRAAARHQPVDAEIKRRFLKPRAVFVLDMAGFSISVRRHGIIHHLALICQMRQTVSSQIRATGGHLLNFHADNALAVFRTVPQALRAARQINDAFATHNRSTPANRHIHASIGIGFGDILLAHDDVFGDEVNLASKLGEDLAQPDEILLTASARQRLPARSHRCEALKISVAGLHLHAFKLRSDPKL